MMKKIDTLMEQAIARGVFPGSTLLIADSSSIAYHKSYGTIQEGDETAVTSDTVFDLASLTKPLVTAPAIMQLIRNKAISLDTRVADLFDQFAGASKKDITIADLLAHISGLPAHRPYYKKLRDVSEEKRMALLQSMVLSEPLETVRGETVVYSDLGFMILGWVIEKLSGQPLSEFSAENIFNLLDINTLFFPADKTASRQDIVYSATEKCPWRKKTLLGEVHDDNAWIAGGIFGHAGLFGTAMGVFQLLREYLDVYTGKRKSPVFDVGLLKVFLSEYKNIRRTFGFDMPSVKDSSSGDFFSKRSVGHLGFTGTSFWMDPDNGIIIILLTNRVNPSRDNIKIRKFRPEIHNLIVQLMK